MKSFKDFGITTKIETFIGDKIKIYQIVNRQIEVHKFKIQPSSQNEGLCLHLQIKIGESLHVLFTGSKYLIESIKQVPLNEFPFITTIISKDKSYDFS